MKNAGKKNWLSSFFIFFGLALLATTGSAFTERAPTSDVSCTPPQATVSDQSSGSVTFTWGAQSGAISYQIYYTREEDSYTSTPVTTGNTYISFTNLPAGTYDFYFRTNCDRESSDYIILDDLIM